MRASVDWMSVALAMLAALAVSFFLAMMHGCASTTALESYRSEELACVSKAATKAEADACRSAVEDHYCGPGGALRDAGGCDQ